MGFKEEGKWWVSPGDDDERVTCEYNFPKKIEILDTTLRDGEQEAGIIFTKEDKLAIAKKLDAAGVHRIEGGCPTTSEEDAEALREICAAGLNADIYCFVRGVLSDQTGDGEPHGAGGGPLQKVATRDFGLNRKKDEKW